MNFNHENTCKCVICSGEMTRKKPTAKEGQLMKAYGWYHHLVVADPYVATGFNFHTHGFDQIGHSDLQIVFPMPEKRAFAIAKTIYDQIQAGKRFGDKNGTLIPHQDGSKYPIRFIGVREGDRQVLRVIVPNYRGELEPEHVAEHDEPEYALQWTVTAV